MIILKQGVDVRGLHNACWEAVYFINRIYERMSVDLVITSALDGKHGSNSFHYLGLAFDIRVRNIPSMFDRMEVSNEISAILGSSYDVVLEKTHIHVEFDNRSLKHNIASFNR